MPAPASKVLRICLGFIRPARAPRGNWASSGHLIPTAVCLMHSVQMGRPQAAQETRVSLFGCR
jgi:hypothetical protein